MNALVRYSAELAPYVPPEWPADLQLQIDRFIAGPIRFKGADGDLVLKPEPLVYHPDAARLADVMRAERTPADRARIGTWLAHLTWACLPKTPEGEAAVAFLNFVGGTSGDLPWFCWTHETLIAAGRAFEWWPTPRKLDELLRPIADRHLVKLRALEAAAKVPPTPVPNPPAPCRTDAACENARAAILDALDAKRGRKAVLPERTVEEQLVEIGHPS